jgi:nucleotide-binding universal stress UspA family protein
MKILLATDGSQSAQEAIDYILNFPLPQDSEFVLLTVIEKELYKSKKKTQLNKEQLQLLEQTKLMLQDEADDLLNPGVDQITAAGHLCTPVIRSGHPSREIVRMAKKKAVDLVVVGSHGLGGVKRFLLGSVSDKVLAYAHCSVLIVKPPFISESKTASRTTSAAESGGLPDFKIMLAYDDSGPAKHAVDFCASLQLPETAEIHLLTVLPLMKLYRQDIKQQLSWVWKDRKKMAEKSLHQLRTEIQWSTPKIETHLREAPDVSQEILSMLAQYGCNLIMLGHKGKGAIEKFLLGSVTSRIAHHATCSILAVKTEMK